ncbi:MAG: ATP-binding protein [Gammaproteobacteria bacterium]|nr:ATP-binding protein [Gammaproteobacteria bacterium]
MQKGTPSVFDRIAQTGLTPEQARKVRTDYQAGRFGEVFPAGSSGVPTLMVGREAQIRQLSNLADEILGNGRRNLIGMTVYGPRGTGKTALLNAFADSLDGLGRKSAKTNTMKMTGTVLESDAALVSRLAQFGQPGREQQRGLKPN